MLQIDAPIDVICKYIGKQKIDQTEYRLLTYTQFCKVEDGSLLYNLITKEMVFLDNEETIAFEKFDFSNKLLSTLIENWFIVPNGFDDLKLSNQADYIYRTVADRIKYPPIKHFVIYTTSDCNARCFYCFELKCKRINMTTQTAYDVAEFIKEKSNGKYVQLSWFGGEPLFNFEAIDIICSKLKNYNIDYKSHITTNGYLFNEQMVKKAKELWNTFEIQISLDGTEKIYNKTKAYIYKKVPSPFLRVLNNIELLLKQNIVVHIRLNMDMHNCEDLNDLCKLLVSRFKKYSGFYVYVSMLFENSALKKSKRLYDEKVMLCKKYDELNDFLEENNVLLKQYVEIYRTIKPCMAVNNETVTVLPDGRLGKCEHYIEDHTFGSIYSEEIDETVIEKFKEMTIVGEQCHICPLLPKCRYLKNCPTSKGYCDLYDQDMNMRYFKKQMKNSYEFFKNNQPNE